MFSREDTNNEEKWYDCIKKCCKMPKCLRDVKCCELKIPKFISDFQTKLKNAKPSLEQPWQKENWKRRSWYYKYQITIKKIWRKENFLTFLGLLFILSLKPSKFLASDVVFPAVDVITDIDAANKHFKYVYQFFLSSNPNPYACSIFLTMLELDIFWTWSNKFDHAHIGMPFLWKKSEFWSWSKNIDDTQKILNMEKNWMSLNKLVTRCRCIKH